MMLHFAVSLGIAFAAKSGGDVRHGTRTYLQHMEDRQARARVPRGGGSDRPRALGWHKGRQHMSGNQPHPTTSQPHPITFHSRSSFSPIGGCLIINFPISQDLTGNLTDTHTNTPHPATHPHARTSHPPHFQPLWVPHTPLNVVLQCPRGRFSRPNVSSQPVRFTNNSFGLPHTHFSLCLPIFM